MSVTIEENFDHIPKIKEAVEYITSHHIQIGVFGDDDSELLMIARVQEFGVQIEVTEAMRGYLWATGMGIGPDTEYINIPERSFMRAGYDANKDDFNRTAEDLIQQVLALEIEPKAAFEAIGLQIQSAIQEYLTDLDEPANHPYTVDKKNRSNPLVNTGSLRDRGITYKIVSD